MRVLYLEGEPNGVRFVSGTLVRMGVAHEIARPGGPLPRDLSRFQAAILSDFPRSHLLELEPLLRRAATEGGLGLLMLGGCRSFGRGGYRDTPLGTLLPVEVIEGDDRVVVSSGLMVERTGAHPILRGIEWAHPVVITGYNRVKAKPATSTVLIGRAVEGGGENVRLAAHREPLLVVREAEALGGRTAALATSLAPPWCGGLIGWGSRPFPIGEKDEVGSDYSTLVMNLVRWVAGEETIRRPLPEWEGMADLTAQERAPGLRVVRQEGTTKQKDPGQAQGPSIAQGETRTRMP